MQGVFNPNIPIYHLPNSAEGLHFSAFHLYRFKIFHVNTQLGVGISLMVITSVHSSMLSLSLPVYRLG